MYIQVLKQLSSKGIGVEDDILNVFKKVQHIPFKERDKQIEDFIADMVKNEHITGYYNSNRKEAKALITIKGYEYYLKYKTDLYTRRYSVLSIILSLLAIAITGVSAWQNQDLELRVRQIEQQNKQVSTSQRQKVSIKKSPDTICQKK